MARISKSVFERFVKQTRKYQKLLTSLIERDVNESDTEGVNPE